MGVLLLAQLSMSSLERSPQHRNHADDEPDGPDDGAGRHRGEVGAEHEADDGRRKHHLMPLGTIMQRRL